MINKQIRLGQRIKGVKKKKLGYNQKNRFQHWMWRWVHQQWVKTKKTVARRRQKGNKRFSLEQRYIYNVRQLRWLSYDTRRIFIDMFVLKHPVLPRHVSRQTNILLWKMLCKWYRIPNLQQLKILYKKFMRLYYYYYSFIYFLNYRIDNITRFARLAFNISRSFDLIKLHLLFCNNKCIYNLNVFVQSGDLISLSWFFFFSMKISRKFYLIVGQKVRRKLTRRILVLNYKIWSFIFLGRPTFKFLNRLGSRRIKKSPVFFTKDMLQFRTHGNFLFF